MHHCGHVLRIKKRAVGSIVGAAFFLMIFFTGYMYYTLSNQVTMAQQRTMGEIRNFDNDRSQELLVVNPPVPVSNEEAVTIQVHNMGQIDLTINDIGFALPGISLGVYEHWEYATSEPIHPIAVSRSITDPPTRASDFRSLLIDPDNPCVIAPQESLTFKITVSGIDVTNQSVHLQFLTERGRVFESP